MIKKGYIVLLCIFFYGLSHSQLLFKISHDSLQAFSYSGGDEFTAPSLNYDYWKGPWTAANMAQNFRYNMENVRLEDGVVNFVMLKKDSVYTLRTHEIDSNFIRQQKISVENYKYPLKYSAGMIITKEKLHYGLYELKFKVEEGKGVWPAFWFYGGTKNDEIDVFEMKGERNNELHVDMHCPYGCDRGYKNKLGINTNFGGWMRVSDYLHNGYNIMLLEWRKDEILWYMNGYPIAYFKGKMESPMNLFLNTQVAADGRAFQPGPDETTVFPNNFYVDYLRIWKQSYQQAPLILKRNSQIGLSKKFETKYSTTKPLTKRGLMYSRKKFKNEAGLVSITLSGTKMYVTVLGHLSETAKVFIQGKALYQVTDFSKENEFMIQHSENELELVIQTKEKEFRKKITIAD